jgi:hypothetical protein
MENSLRNQKKALKIAENAYKKASAAYDRQLE